MLSMKSVSKVFKTDLVETHALRDFNLEVNEGEFVAVTVLLAQVKPRF